MKFGTTSYYNKVSTKREYLRIRNIRAPLFVQLFASFPSRFWMLLLLLLLSRNAKLGVFNPTAALGTATLFSRVPNRYSANLHTKGYPYSRIYLPSFDETGIYGQILWVLAQLWPQDAQYMARKWGRVCTLLNIHLNKNRKQDWVGWTKPANARSGTVVGWHGKGDWMGPSLGDPLSRKYQTGNVCMFC